MKARFIIFTTGAFLTIFPAVSRAQILEKSFNYGVTSDYIWRGTSQSKSNPAAFIGYDINYGNFSVGTWASSVNIAPNTDYEADLYLSYKPEIGPFGFEIGALAYLYPQDNDLNLFEGKIGATYSFKNSFMLSAATYFSPEYGKNGPSSKYYEGAINFFLPQKYQNLALGIGVSIGKYDFDHTIADYNNYKIALNASSDNGWGTEIGFTDTDVKDDTNAKAKTYFTLKKTY